MKKTGLALAAASTLATGAYATNFVQNSAIDILTALQVSETTQLDFGIIEKVTGADKVVHVTTGGLVGGSNTATHIDTSTVSEGVYNITGSSIKTISISASNVGNVAGLTFTAITGSYNGGSDQNLMSGATGLAAPGAAGKALDVGAELTVTSAVAEGTYAPQFNLDVNYE